MDYFSTWSTLSGLVKVSRFAGPTMACYCKHGDAGGVSWISAGRTSGVEAPNFPPCFRTSTWSANGNSLHQSDSLVRMVDAHEVQYSQQPLP